MNTADLSLEQTPPFSVPARFFLTAPLFAVGAILLLLFMDNTVLSTRWHPVILGVTHCITLGVMMMVMMGALLQLLPILAGIRLPHPIWISRVFHTGLTVGTLALSFAFIQQSIFLFQSAFILLSLTLGGFILFIAYQLFFNVAVYSEITRGMQWGISALLITILLGTALTYNIAFSNIIVMIEQVTNIHAMWGLVGWSSLLIIAVAYQVVPMFHITPHYPAVLTRFLVPSIFMAVMAWTTAVIMELSPFIITILSYLIVGLLLIFSFTTFYLHTKRLRKVKDLTLNFWRLGLAGIISSCLLWGSVQFYTLDKFELLLGSVFILLGILPIIQGMLYKIIAFLIWLHLQQTKMRLAVLMFKTPNMKQVIQDKHARLQFLSYALGSISFCLHLIYAHPVLYWLSMVCLISTFLGLFFILIQAVSVYNKTHQSIIDYAAQQSNN